MTVRRELVVVGAGPAGLCAAIEAARHGVDVAVYDENAKPGGQLFKQIHKFFGSREHRAAERGYKIGNDLLAEAEELGVEVVLGAVALGVYENKTINVRIDNRIERIKGDCLILATGASENMIPFPGWTLPGVMGAGAAQTLANLHGIRPGNDLLMVGCGNVGVVVAHQMLMIGCRIAAMIDAAPEVRGYGVHAAKVARAGVPFHLSHTIVEARGEDRVESAVVAAVDSSWQPIPGSEKELDVDAVCLAVGLNPSTQLAQMAGCRMVFVPFLGGLTPANDEDGMTSVPGLYVAGDVSGIEEASAAMIEGRLAGAAAAKRLGYADPDVCSERACELRASLAQLRKGAFGDRVEEVEQLMDKILKEAACRKTY